MPESSTIHTGDLKITQNGDPPFARAQWSRGGAGMGMVPARGTRKKSQQVPGIWSYVNGQQASYRGPQAYRLLMSPGREEGPGVPQTPASELPGKDSSSWPAPSLQVRLSGGRPGICMPGIPTDSALRVCCRKVQGPGPPATHTEGHQGLKPWSGCGMDVPGWLLHTAWYSFRTVLGPTLAQEAKFWQETRNPP